MTRKQSLTLPGFVEVRVSYTWTSAGPEDVQVNLGIVDPGDLEDLLLPTPQDVESAVDEHWRGVVWGRQGVA